MQYPNNTENKNRKKIIIIIVVLFVLIFLALSLFLLSKKKSNENKGEYYDPGSGETISNPKDKTPENNGNTESEPVFLGFSKLLDSGVTQFQVDGIKYALIIYSRENNNFIKEASLTVDSVKQGTSDPESLVHNVESNMTLNRTDKIQAKYILDGLKSVKVVLSRNGKVIYESDSIDSTEYSPNINND